MPHSFKRTKGAIWEGSHLPVSSRKQTLDRLTTAAAGGRKKWRPALISMAKCQSFFRAQSVISYVSVTDS